MDFLKPTGLEALGTAAAMTLGSAIKPVLTAAGSAFATAIPYAVITASLVSTILDAIELVKIRSSHLEDTKSYYESVEKNTEFKSLIEDAKSLQSILSGGWLQGETIENIGAVQVFDQAFKNLKNLEENLISINIKKAAGNELSKEETDLLKKQVNLRQKYQEDVLQTYRTVEKENMDLSDEEVKMVEKVYPEFQKDYEKAPWDKTGLDQLANKSYLEVLKEQANKAQKDREDSEKYEYIKKNRKIDETTKYQEMMPENLMKGKLLEDEFLKVYMSLNPSKEVIVENNEKQLELLKEISENTDKKDKNYWSKLNVYVGSGDKQEVKISDPPKPVESKQEVKISDPPKPVESKQEVKISNPPKPVESKQEVKISNPPKFNLPAEESKPTIKENQQPNKPVEAKPAKVEKESDLGNILKQGNEQLISAIITLSKNIKPENKNQASSNNYINNVVNSAANSGNITVRHQNPYSDKNRIS